MRLRPLPTNAMLLVLTSCAGTPHERDLAAWLEESPQTMPARLWIAGDRIVRAAAALGPGMLPPEVRTTVEAVAPAGDLRFAAREFGPLGDGYRIEKHYPGANPEHSRTVLVNAVGDVLERGHTVPIADVPRDILAAALRVAPTVLTAWILSDGHREKGWECVVQNRIGHTLVVTIDLDGTLRTVLRRTTAQLDS